MGKRVDMKCRCCRTRDALTIRDSENYTGLALCGFCQEPVYVANIKPMYEKGLGELADAAMQKVYGWPESLR